MIVYDSPKSPRPLLAPQFDGPGPYAPGATALITLPVRNERPTAETNLRIRFHGDGCTLEPEEVTIDRIDGREQQNVETVATVLPSLDGRRQIRVWAELTGSSVGTVTTAEALAPISLRTGISLVDDGDAILVTNDGDLPVDVYLDVDGPFDTPALRFDDHGSSERFTLAPNDPRRIPNASYIGRIIARAENGERAIIHRRPADKTTPLLETHLEIETPDNGARHQDLCPFMLSITNVGNTAARDCQMDLTFPDGVTVATDLLTIDDVRVLSDDRTVSKNAFNLKLGRLSPNATTIARGAFVVSADASADDATLNFEGVISASNAPPTPIRRGISVDRAPLFVPHSTYIGDPIEKDDGSVQLDVVVTHSEARPIAHAYLQLEIHGARITSVGNGQFGTYPLQPTTVGSRRVMNVKLGRLEADQRIIARIQLAPTPTNAQEHHIGVRAALMADGHSIDLGTRPYVITGKADLRQSILDRYDLSPLRLNMPATVHLTIRNTGTIPAKDVRVAFATPEDVSLDMPTEPQGRWYPLVSNLPPGGSAGMPITMHLLRPPNGIKVVIGATVDAENAPDVALDPITIETPSTPDVRASAPITRALDHGMIAVATRISNEGDGLATAVVLLVPETDHPLPRTTTVDGALVAEDTTASVLIEGLDLGDLPPGTFREVSWVVAPPPTTYRANITVTSSNSDLPEGIKRSSVPTTSHVRRGFASELPHARVLDDATTNQQPKTRFAHATITEERTALAADTATRALPYNAQDTQPHDALAATAERTGHDHDTDALPAPDGEQFALAPAPADSSAQTTQADELDTIDTTFVPQPEPRDSAPPEPQNSAEREPQPQTGTTPSEASPQQSDQSGYRSFTEHFQDLDERSDGSGAEEDGDDLRVIPTGESLGATAPGAAPAAPALGAIAVAVDRLVVRAGDPLAIDANLPAESWTETLRFELVAIDESRKVDGALAVRDMPVIHAEAGPTGTIDTRRITIPLDGPPLAIGPYRLALEVPRFGSATAEIVVTPSATNNGHVPTPNASTPPAQGADTDLWGRGEATSPPPPIAPEPDATTTTATPAAAEPTPPPEIPSGPRLSGPMVRRLLDFTQDLTDPELDTLNGWKHLLVLRVLADPQLTHLTHVADACAESIMPGIIARAWTHATPGFANAVATYDDNFRQALIACGHSIDGPQPGAVDAALTRALPNQLDHPNEQLRAAYTEYVDTLRDYIDTPRMSSLAKVEREQIFTATPIIVADECLARLAATVGEL